MLSEKTRKVIEELYNLREYSLSCKRTINLLFSYASMFATACASGMALIGGKKLFEKILNESDFIENHSTSLSCQEMALAALSFSLLVGAKYSDQIKKVVYEENGLKHYFDKLLMSIGKNLKITPSFDSVSFGEFLYLIEVLEDFESNHINKNEGIDNENRHEAFLKHLEQLCKVDELLILHKLGADYQDCYLDIFEEIDAKRMTKGSNSLLWLSAKVVNDNGASLEVDAPDDLKNLITINKKYCAVRP